MTNTTTEPTMHDLFFAEDGTDIVHLESKENLNLVLYRYVGILPDDLSVTEDGTLLSESTPLTWVELEAAEAKLSRLGGARLDK